MVKKKKPMVFNTYLEDGRTQEENGIGITRDRKMTEIEKDKVWLKLLIIVGRKQNALPLTECYLGINLTRGNINNSSF